MDGKTIPLYGALNVTNSTYVEYLDGEKPQIINVELSDAESARFNKYQLAGGNLSAMVV